LAGSFRADRYGPLLAGGLLPATPPFADRRRRLWQRLREEQRYYQEAKGDQVFSAEKRRALPAETFGRLVLALHGARLPRWLKEE
jgi:hypothetical protein